MAILILVSKICLGFTISVLTLYAIRHYLLALYRLSLRGPREMMDIVGFEMPHISVLIPMHNEEAVAGDVLQALVDGDYDWTRLEILAINDRSQDRTGEIIDDYAARYPIIKALHRQTGAGGKGAALRFATGEAKGEILLVFDADYFPGRAMLKQLVAPFCDPEVGAVMGRVVPHNVGASLLSGLLELERSAGYQISQQARHNLRLAPQYGGTVGGVRVSALKRVGGWNVDSITEDTDLTFRLLSHGLKVAYVNRAECYEEAPETWPVRRRQIMRWATGHTQCLHRFWHTLILTRWLTLPERIDALFVLGCYWTAPILILGWFASLVLFFTPEAHTAPILLVALALVGYQLFGNQATFLELGVGALLDGNQRRILLMPLNLFNFFASTGAISSALMLFYLGRFFGKGKHHWHKTQRYRGDDGNGNGGNGKVFQNGPPADRSVTRSPNGLYLSSKLRVPWL
jgi:cellulose synthase/poly-beta-1,6-N-acetylglucosamine synthase-like glycosyltransferase